MRSECGCNHDQAGEAGPMTGHGASSSKALLPHSAGWVDIATLMLLATFLIWSVAARQTRFFVATYYAWLPLPTAAILLAMAAARLRNVVRGRRACDCAAGASRLPQRVLCMAILMGAVAAVLVVHPTSYSAEWLRKRAPAGPPRDPQLQRAILWVQGIKTKEPKKTSGSFQIPSDPTVVDLVNAGSQGYCGAMEGKFVSVIGQSDIPGGSADDRFGLYRLVVTCCVADAVAVSMEVRGTPNARIEPGAWIRVGGILKFDSGFDPTMPVVHASTISQIPEPNRPYL